MPIKFACPKCKAVMSVADSMAGKAGKCKCGNPIKVPAAKSATIANATGTNPAMSAMLDELTESDFNRESPHKKIYESKKTGNDAAALKRFEGEDVKEAKLRSKNLNAVLIVLAVLNFLGGLSMIGIAVGLAVATAAAEQLNEALPLTKAGLGVAIAICVVNAIILIGGGVGVLLKKTWGWFLLAVAYTSAVVDRLFSFGMIFTGEFTQAKFYGGMIPLFISLGLLMLVYRDENQAVCKVKSTTTSILAAVVGLLLGAGVIGILFATGAVSLSGDTPSS